MATTVRIAWGRDFGNEIMWNEVCAWAIEYFGLPGDRFTTAINVEYMDFVFRNPNDALLMSIQWSAPIVPDEELTAEHVAKFL